MRKVLFLLVIVLLLSVSITEADQSCRGVVVRNNLPIELAPSYWNTLGHTPFTLTLRQAVTIDKVYFNQQTGEIWFHISQGWAQAYSGYSTGMTSILFSDGNCTVSVEF